MKVSYSGIAGLFKSPMIHFSITLSRHICLISRNSLALYGQSLAI